MTRRVGARFFFCWPGSSQVDFSFFNASQNGFYCFGLGLGLGLVLTLAGRIEISKECPKYIFRLKININETSVLALFPKGRHLYLVKTFTIPKMYIFGRLYL